MQRRRGKANSSWSCICCEPVCFDSPKVAQSSWLLFMCHVISRKGHALDGGTSQRFKDSKVYQPFNELYCGFMIVWRSGNVDVDVFVYVWRIFVRFSQKKDKYLREVISVFHFFQMHSVLFLSSLNLINQKRINRCKQKGRVKGEKQVCKSFYSVT